MKAYLKSLVLEYVGLKILFTIMSATIAVIIKRRLKMLEGNELEGKIGEAGSYAVDVNDKGVAKLTVEIDVVAELEKLAKRTDNQIDDKIVAMVKSALGR